MHLDDILIGDYVDGSLDGARHAEVEFLLRVGEYQAGSDPLADRAIERMPAIKALLQQRSDEPADMGETLAQLREAVQ